MANAELNANIKTLIDPKLLRRWYAGMAMQGIIASGKTFDPHTDYDLAMRSFHIADAMIRFEEEEKNNDSKT